MWEGKIRRRKMSVGARGFLFSSPTFSSSIYLGSRLMPIQVRTTTCRLDEPVFGKIVYDVMRCVFDIHSEFGRFFDEKIYKRELGRRFPGTELEEIGRASCRERVEDTAVEVTIKRKR